MNERTSGRTSGRTSERNSERTNDPMIELTNKRINEYKTGQKLFKKTNYLIKKILEINIGAIERFKL